MTTYERLLAVQGHDTALDQLRHRRDALPGRAAVAEATEAVAGLDRRLAGVDERRHELGRQQKRFEDEIAAVDAKRAEVEGTLYGGAVTAARELQALQDEIAALDRRKRSLEDDELEVLEAIEGVEAEQGALQAERAEAADRLAAEQAALAEAEAEVDAELATEQAARDAAVAAVGDDAAVADYESLRSTLGGIAVARLTGAQCGGCHLALPAVEVDRIRHLPADARVTCEECGRLLVR